MAELPVLAATFAAGELSLPVVARMSEIATPDNEADLSALITAAEAAVAARCGPLEATPLTKRVRGGRALVLPTTPVISVTTVTGKSGSVVDAGTYYVWGDSGVITSDGGFSEEFYDVAYSAGRTACPADLKEAVKETARDLWLPRRGPAGNGVAGSPEGSDARRRAEQFMAPYLQPGFA